jgi:hypothetical protein
LERKRRTSAEKQKKLMKQLADLMGKPALDDMPLE